MNGINEEPMAIAVRDNRIHSLEVCALVLANEPIIYVAYLQVFVSTLTPAQCNQLIIQAYSNTGGIELAKSVLSMGIQDPMPNPQNKPTWCICTKCRNMDQMIENVCCRMKPCVTTTEIFESVVLNRDVLSVAIVDRHDVLVEDATYTPEKYRKSAYRQWIMWRVGYLGNGVRRVVPSCVVWVVRDRYPAPDRRYLGFKEY